MTTIAQLQKLDLQKIDNDLLKSTITELIEEHDQAEDKKDFIAVNQQDMNKLYTLVKELTPEAIGSKLPPCDPNEETSSSKEQLPKDKSQIPNNKSPNPIIVGSKKETSKSKSPKTDSKRQVSKNTSKKPKGNPTLDAFQKEIAACRVKIRKYNEEKRKAAPPKPKPSRYDKLKKHLLAMGRLVPTRLKDNTTVKEQTKEVLLETYRQLIQIYGLSEAKGKAIEAAIMHHYGQGAKTPKTS